MSEVRAKKALGQHFLVDLNIARKICDALSGGNNTRGRAGGAGVPGSSGSAGVRGSAASARVSGDAGDTGVAESARVYGGARVAGDTGVAASARVSGDAGDTGVAERARVYGGARVAGDTGVVASARVSESAGGTGVVASCDVLEVGCGMGVLTQFLLRREDIVIWGAEIDRESVAYLQLHYPAFTPRLIEGDFLRLDLRERFPQGLNIIGNFPYNISSQIFFKVLEHRDLVGECVGMIQKEVAVRLAEPPGSKQYGILSVLLQAWYDIEYLFTVNETVFNPPPKVKSAVIRLRRNATERLGCDEQLFVRVVKASFGQRRKMIRNALRAAFGDFAGAEHPFFTRRAEQLSVSDFVELTTWVAQNCK